MTFCFVDLIKVLERHAERAALEGDLDLNQIEELVLSVPSYESEITPELAKRCDNAIDKLHGYFEKQLKIIIQSSGAIKQSRKALRGYQDTGLRSQPMRVYRNV